MSYSQRHCMSNYMYGQISSNVDCEEIGFPDAHTIVNQQKIYHGIS